MSRKWIVAVALAVGLSGVAGIADAAPGRSDVSTNQPIVTPGAFCSTPNALGKSKNGVQMKCTYIPADDRSRWRAK